MLRRRLRLSAAAVVGLLIAASAAVLGTEPTSAAPVEDPVVDVTIDSFTPVAPKPGELVQIKGRVTNTTDLTFRDPQALACIDRQRLSTGADIAAVSAEQDVPMNDRVSCQRLTRFETFQQFGAPLAPKATVQFTLTVPWAEWQISKATGVYVVGVVFRGQPEENNPGRITAGRVRTLMPVIGSEPLTRKVNTALVVPLRHRPTQLGGRTFANDSLAQSMAPNGPLGRLLALGRTRKVTWLVDPAMLDEARRIKDGKDGYVVVGDGGQTPGTGQKVVTDWLNEFDKSRDQGNQVVLLPYGDPDVAGLIDAGGPVSKLVGDARATSEEYLLAPGSSVPGTFTNGLWLENGAARSRYLAAASSGFRGSTAADLNLVGSSSWSPAERPALNSSPVYNVLTPEGPKPEVRTVIANSALTTGGPDLDTAENPLQVRQRFAAETALLAAGGSRPVSVVALPPRGWDTEGNATAAIAGDLSLPWITPTDVGQIVASARQPQTTRAPNAGRANPALTAAQVDAVKRLDDATQTFRNLLTVSENLDENIERALLRSASNSWRGYADEAQRFTAIETGSVNQQLGKVRLVNSNVEEGRQGVIKVNLAGSKGTFPLTVSNELNESIRVGIQVTPANRTDLRIKPLQTKVLPPRGKATYLIEASAEQNGLIRANAQVITASGRPVGRSQELVIEAAQYGSVGWILVGAACALLFGTSFVRIYRRIRTERRSPAPAEPVTDPLHPAPIDPGPDASTDVSLKEGVGSKDG
ncbi:hypothetical protein E1218_09255 [Kribbella turkmenica]|uniref:Glycoprotein n=1 Tax=Kribbella turkmenica TaxID=2530375 RepID=A0A4R4XB40_9ACTN|nr:DUF6049 family protein [Kribbella turkmenica]TDD27841.1 hypothetical protein E1218_09255 [Kribbella turkmenica]